MHKRLAAGGVLWTTAALFMVSAYAPAFAQDAPAEDEIVVTAQKREGNLADTPIAMSVLSGDELAAQGISTVDEALRTATGVQVQGLAQGGQVFIRGVGSAIDPQFADPAVALMVDGVYNGRTEGITAGGFDIERMEVLRGPQGTLYGRNATGGVVNVITRTPELGEFGGYGRVQLGNFGEVRGEAAVNIPLSAHMALRFAGFKHERDGFIGDGSWDANTLGLRASLLIEPTDAFSVVARAEIYDEDDAGIQTVAAPGSAGNLTFPPPIFFTNFDPPTAIPANALTCPGSPFIGCAPIARFPNGWPTYDDGDPWSSSPQFPAGERELHSEMYSLQVEADLGFADLTVLPAYATHETRLVSSYLFGNLTGPYQVQEPEATYQSVEARLASKADAPFDWIVGAYYFQNEGGTLTGVTGPYTTVQTNDPTETLAAFGEASIPLSDAFRLTGGLRFSRDSNGNTNRITAPPAFDSGDILFSQEVDSSTFKIGFEYDVGESGLFYGHVASGFKQGGVSPTVPARTFEPEELLAYELGYKNDRAFGGRGSLFASAFAYQYENYQLQFFDVIQLGSTGEFGNFLIIGNAGDAEIFGMEIEGDFELTDSDVVTAALTYLDSAYGDFTLPNNPFVNQGPFQLEGHQMANSPELTASFGYEHTWMLEGGGDLSAGITTRYVSGYFATSEVYLPGAEQDAFTRSDAQLRYEPAGGAWSISGFVRNIEDDAQTTYVFPAYRRFVSQPRTYGVTVDVNF